MTTINRSTCSDRWRVRTPQFYQELPSGTSALPAPATVGPQYHILSKGSPDANRWGMPTPQFSNDPTPNGAPELRMAVPIKPFHFPAVLQPSGAALPQYDASIGVVKPSHQPSSGSSPNSGPAAYPPADPQPKKGSLKKLVRHPHLAPLTPPPAGDAPVPPKVVTPIDAPKPVAQTPPPAAAAPKPSAAPPLPAAAAAPQPSAAPPHPAAAAQPLILVRVSGPMRTAVNSCTSNPLDDVAIGTILAKMKSSKELFLAGKTNGIARSVLGKRFILMTHSKNGGDIRLGSGSYKVVKCTVDTTTCQRKAVAVFRKQVKPHATPAVRKEIAFMQACAGIDEVVHLDHWFETAPNSDNQGKIYIIMPEYNLGSLKDSLTDFQKLKVTLTEENALNVALDVTRAIEGVHKLGILHRDIKAGNVFLFDVVNPVSGKRELHAKLGDFGLCCLENDMEAREKLAGTPKWFSRDIAQLILKGVDKKKLAALRTKESEVEALGYMLYLLFHPQHAQLPHLSANTLVDAYTKCAQLLNPAELAKQLAPLKPEHQAILKGIFTQHWSAAKVREELEKLKK